MTNNKRFLVSFNKYLEHTDQFIFAVAVINVFACAVVSLKLSLLYNYLPAMIVAQRFNSFSLWLLATLVSIIKRNRT